MYGCPGAFFGLKVATPLVRGGADAWLPKDRNGGNVHTLFNVYGEMLLQIMRDYSSLPDPRTLTLAEIRFLYAGLRRELRRHTVPRKG